MFGRIPYLSDCSSYLFQFVIEFQCNLYLLNRISHRSPHFSVQDFDRIPVSVNLFFMMSYSSCELFFRLDWVLNCFSAAENPCFQPSLVALLTFSYSDGSLNLILLPIFASSPKMATHLGL